jgi:hypothetical protein
MTQEMVQRKKESLKTLKYERNVKIREEFRDGVITEGKYRRKL